MSTRKLYLKCKMAPPNYRNNSALTQVINAPFTPEEVTSLKFRKNCVGRSATSLFSKNVKSSRACYVRATSLLSSCCVGGVPTEFIVRADAVRAASKRFPLRPRYVRADCDSLYLRLRHVNMRSGRARHGRSCCYVLSVSATSMLRR